MTSIYKKVVINQIIKELDFMICLYGSYQTQKDSLSNEDKKDHFVAIFESIENLIPYQEVWHLYRQYLELDDCDDSVEIEEEVVKGEEER